MVKRKIGRAGLLGAALTLVVTLMVAGTVGADVDVVIEGKSAQSN